MSAAPHADGPRLLADIGGSHARFALETAPGRILGAASLDCAEYRRFEDAVGDYLANRAPLHARAVRHVVVAMAAGDGAARPIHPWSGSIAAALDGLHLDTLLVVNDSTALAMALPGLPHPVLAGAAALLAQALGPAAPRHPSHQELSHAS